MNHYPKFSLILLIPFSIMSSSPENKPSKGITFVQNKTNNAHARNMLISATVSTNANSASIELIPTSSNQVTTKPTTANNDDASTNNLVIVDFPAQDEEPVIYKNELGLPYSRMLAPKQNNVYVEGEDGISKFLKLETSSTYIDRLVTTGKIAGAAANIKKSFLPDHLRRTIECKQEELAKKSDVDKNLLLELLKKQREANTKQFSELSVLFDVTKKHASRNITLSTIEAFIQQIRSIEESKKLLATTIAQEFAEQNAILQHLSSQLDALKKSQFSQIAQ